MSQRKMTTGTEAAGANGSERRAARPAGGAPMLPAVPDPEVAAKPTRRRGRKPDPSREWRERIAELESEKARLQERLRQAEAIIAAQKNLSEILGLPLATAAQRESA